MTTEGRNSVDIYDELNRCIDGLKDLQTQINRIVTINRTAIDGVRLRQNSTDARIVTIESLAKQHQTAMEGIRLRQNSTDEMEGMTATRNADSHVVRERFDANEKRIADLENRMEEAKIGRMILNMPTGSVLTRTHREWVYGRSDDPFHDSDLIHTSTIEETLTKAGLDK